MAFKKFRCYSAGSAGANEGPVIIKKKEKPFTQNNDLNEHKNVEKNSTCHNVIRLRRSIRVF